MIVTGSIAGTLSFSILLGSNLASTPDRYDAARPDRSFSILLGSNLASTSAASTSTETSGTFSILLGSNLASTPEYRCVGLLPRSFSILLGSNLASTIEFPPRAFRSKFFQYPPRIEPRFNKQPTACKIYNSDFQYPPRIEPRFNALAKIAGGSAVLLSVSSPDRTSLQPPYLRSMRKFCVFFIIPHG